MKSFTPRPRSGNSRIVAALFISFLILVTPIMPLASASARRAGTVKSNSSSTDLRPHDSMAASWAEAFIPPIAIISATKTDSFPDPNNDGKAEPGDTITYDVNVANTGAADATGVTFADTIDANTTLVPGSFKISPLAFADSYNATKDTLLNIAAPGVLANDTGTPLPTAQPIAAGATTQGGSVTLYADGSFNYTPPSGFIGADTFTYTATNGLLPNDTATVTINIDAAPVVTSTVPTNGATSVATNSNITVNFSEPVNATTSSFSLQCPAGSPQAFTLSASPASSFTLDPVADLPAGTNCTVTVIASQITDADSFDPPDNMSADDVFSFGVRPLAVDDMHSATGNVHIDTAGSDYRVLSNDMGPGITISAFDATSVHGGEVTMNTSTGTFTYNPPHGFTGTDSFNYTISNANGSDQGTVVLTVSDMIWFINNAPGACSSGCDGRLTNPFTSLAAFEALNGGGTTSDGAVIAPEAGDNIFIYSGSGNYTGPLTLENNQRVIGQGATSSIAALTLITLAPDSDALPSTGGTNPVITNSSGGGVILVQNDSLHGFTVSNTTGTGIYGSGFGTLTVSENVIVSNTTTAGTAVSLDNGTLAASFRSISAGNNDANPDPVNGIVLSNTTGSFTVTGDGTNAANGSGGTIQNMTGANLAVAGRGISLSSATNVTLNQMNLHDFSNFAIYGTNVNGFTLNYSVINGTNGNDKVSPNNEEASIRFDNLLGSASISNSTISGGFYGNIYIKNTSGTLNRLTASNNTFGLINMVGGSDNFHAESFNSAVMNLTLQDNTFNGTRGDFIDAIAQENSTMDAVVRRNKFINGQPILSAGGGVVIRGDSVGTAATITFDFSCNRISGSSTAALLVSKGNGNGTMTGSIVNNAIGVSGVPDSGAKDSGDAIFARSAGGGTVTVLIANNNIRQYSSAGIHLQNNSGSSTMNASIFGNLVTEPGSGAFTGLFADNGALGTDTSIMNLVVGSATTPSLQNDLSAGDPSGFADVFFGNANASTQFRLSRNGSASTVPDQIIKDDNQNPANTTTDTSGGFGPITAVTTLPPTPPAVAACTTVALLDVGANQQQYLAQANDVTGANEAGASSVTSTTVVPTSKTSASGEQTLLAHARLAPKASTSNTAQATAKSRALTASPAPSGETVNGTVGTLPAGKTVHIQFQVTVNSPLPGSVTQVSNQGTVSGDNFANVLTDDLAAGGSADPTVTPILTPPDITIKDATASEPLSGSTPAAFSVMLSHSFSQTVTVNFSTADDTGGANPATAGTDYTVTSGTVTFNPGETIQTISVPVLADADNAETNETFLVNLSGATNGTITDGQAVGTITPNSTPGTVVISELRTSGPAGSDDEFVELLNNTDSDITVAASDSSTGWALVKSGSTCSDAPVVVAVIPNGTVIPARGNYLLVGSAYSLAAYATGDQNLTLSINDDSNVALFNTADVGNLQTSTRLDAVGFGSNTGNNCDLLREGTTLQPASSSTSEYSFVRKVDKGETKDTNDNAADFVVVSTTPASPVGSNLAPTLGAPGPENTSSPRGPLPCSNATGTAKIDRARLDTTQGAGSAPNLVRDTTSDPPNNSTYGTLDFRRRFTNSSGGTVTQLRYRIVDMTTNPASPGSADLRARTSAPITVTGVNDAATCGGSTPCSVLVQGTTLETPPLQALGGGVNSSLAAGTVTLGTPLANGASINLRFLFGVQQEGTYHIGIVIETLTTGSLGKDIWELRGNTQTGGDTDGDCNTPPVANAGADQTIECGGGTTAVTLDGSASSDPDGDTPLSYEWREGVTVLGTSAVLNTSLAFGSHTITLKVTDPSGAFSEDTVSVNIVDTTDPMVTAPPNVTVFTGPGATSCGAFVSDATLGTATASDGCAGSLTPTRSGVPAGNNFPVGQTIITYTANDGHGHTKSAMQTVTVVDNTPPTLSVPPDQTVNAPANSCSANVNPGTATANDNCPGVTVTGTRSDSQPLNAPYPVGTTTITWKATDAANNMTTGTQTITVKDATPPTITLTSGTLTMSPPNHSYHTFTIAQLVASVSDSCDGGVDITDVVISQVTSDEIENSNGDGNTHNDIVIAPDCKSVQLRSERSGDGNGRVYKITLQVKDSSGNVATAVRQVFVANSGPVVDSGVHYTVNGCTP